MALPHEVLVHGNALASSNNLQDRLHHLQQWPLHGPGKIMTVEEYHLSIIPNTPRISKWADPILNQQFVGISYWGIDLWSRSARLRIKHWVVARCHLSLDGSCLQLPGTVKRCRAFRNDASITCIHFTMRKSHFFHVRWSANCSIGSSRHDDARDPFAQALQRLPIQADLHGFDPKIEGLKMAMDQNRSFLFAK